MGHLKYKMQIPKQRRKEKGKHEEGAKNVQMKSAYRSSLTIQKIDNRTLDKIIVHNDDVDVDVDTLSWTVRKD